MAKRAQDSVTAQRSRFIIDIINQHRDPTEKDPEVSRVGDSLRVLVPPKRSQQNREFSRCTRYRQSPLGQMLFEAATHAYNGQVEWRQQAAEARRVLFAAFEVQCEGDLVRLWLDHPQGGAAHVLCSMLMDPILPPYMIEFIAVGGNPMAAVSKLVISGPFAELDLQGSAHAHQDQCRRCLQPGPFSSKGYCVPCSQKEGLSDIERALALCQI